MIQYQSYMQEELMAKSPDMVGELLKFARFDDAFLKERRIFLWGPVTDKSCQEVMNRMLYLESIDPGKEIKFYINSPGGMVTSGMSVLDTMNLISSPVATICMGLAASMGSMLLSAGEKGRRFVFPSGRVMIHQPSIGGIYGTASDMEITTEQIVKTRENLAQILADNCGQTLEKVLKDFNRDYWMNAQESMEYGIADGVLSEMI